MPEKAYVFEFPVWVQGVALWIGGMISTLGLALVNRGPALQAEITKQVTAVLAADNDRLIQMSKALDAQSEKIDALLNHVASLEAALARAGLAIPPRPDVGIVDG